MAGTGTLRFDMRISRQPAILLGGSCPPPSTGGRTGPPGAQVEPTGGRDYCTRVSRTNRTSMTCFPGTAKARRVKRP
ncbi:MAG: hypothetical protein NTX87_18430, partial [Planctomycetota bacterium]|nr:hypothetical protein [Planctomycetota bacterium]